MAMIGDKNVGGDKSYAREIRKMGEEMRKDAHLRDEVSAKVAEASKAAKEAGAAQVRQPATKPAAGLPKTPRPDQGEQQGSSAKESTREANQRYTDASNKSRELQKLLSKSPEKIAQKPEVATREGIIQKQPAPDARLPKPQPRQPQQGAAEKGAPRPAARDGADEARVPREGVAQKAKQPDGQEKQAERKTASPEAIAKQAIPLPAAPQAAVAREAGAAEGSEAKDADQDEGAQETSKDPQVSTFAVAGRSPRKKLGGLLGGSAGSDQGAKDGGEKSASAFDARPARIEGKELPEKYEHLKVFSEFDDAVFGPHDLASKALVYRKGLVQVQEKLSQCAALDKELDGRIKDLFAVAPFSERCSGDVKLADVLKSVYGGVLG